MSFEVLLHPKRVKKVITRLPHAHQKKLKDLIDLLTEDPHLSLRSIQISDNDLKKVNFDVKQCKGYSNRFRVRFGDFRLVYEVDEEE